MTSAPTITRFKIYSLFGSKTLELPFNDNKVILVGENGSGKSTLVNALYYLLSCQWSRLASLPFTKIELDINGIPIEVERSKLINLRSARSRLRHFVIQRMHSREQLARIENEFPTLMKRGLADKAEVDRLAELLGVSPMAVMEASFDADEVGARTGEEDHSDYRSSLEERLGAAGEHQILFLPTYRRIERELKALFPKANIERDLEMLHHRRFRSKSEPYLELVEFGMRDVDRLWIEKMRELDRDFRSELNKLTGEYLRDIIRSAYQSAPLEPLISAGVPGMVDDVLGRMDDDILPQQERAQLQQLIRSLQQDPGIREGEGNRVVFHFLSKLIDMHEKQRKREERVFMLVSVCNNYLTDKMLRFDSQQFTLRLVRGDDGEEALPVSALSSGEKQIVSLFTHICLSTTSNHFLIIDEPELSISVSWQKRFLQDIVGTKLCSGLVAVTHSPFIFDNDLDVYARAMDEILVDA